MTEKFHQTLGGIDAARAALPEAAVEIRQLAAETAAAAETSTGSVAEATADLLTALAGSMEAAADFADAAHQQLGEATGDLREWADAAGVEGESA